MENYLLELGNLLLRWLHVIAAIAWIGESIYFVMLDNSLSPPAAADAPHGLHGEMFAVHGGGFYHNQKYLGQPPFPLDDKLHWSFWKSYATWLSGFGLFSLLYLLNPAFYLVNPASPWAWAAALSGGAAAVIAVAFLLGGWLAYDQLCRRISPDMNRDGALSLAVALLMALAAYASSHIFQGRAAFLITGAVMATCMSANVLFWIIPGQRRMVRAIQAGDKPNPLDGLRGKQRSVHNTYFTLPVVFLMISNHYAFTFGSRHAWLIMVLFILSGALIRQYFVLRHSGRQRPLLPALGGLLLVGVALLAAPPPPNTAPAAPQAAADAAEPAAAQTAADVRLRQIHAIIQNRCLSCHSATPSQAGFVAPPAGLKFDDAQEILINAHRIKQAVASKYMPLANLTQMTQEERETLAKWGPAPGR
ncbi:urate hydroxylase PuuD [Chromobacterium sp. S0633]|uniref:urate hydroxylase PuuD n=1 Tax=Chromobacterium sp. S0633 TaxID=2957805 RepID=UPI00209FBE5E|nr:urate hydroxylase PuuD [Chromobacterium sp. S0633]MCP1288748.1 urate hydroxylase PuuD [Chromobacterium sp. S0633]